MANAWVEHVRKWSAANGVSYMCAISKPECKAAYRKPEQMGKSKKAAAAASMPASTATGRTIRVKKSQLKPAAPLLTQQPKPQTIAPTAMDMKMQKRQYRNRAAIDANKYQKLNQID